jgi:hypothetical protein
MMKQKTVLAAVVLSWLLCGCASTTIGKVNLSSGNPPDALKIGKTTQQEVLAQFGEPLGYREQGDRAAMIYEYSHESFAYLFIGAYRQVNAHLLFLVFENNVLIKAEVQRHGWGFEGNIDPQALQILLR